MDLVRRNTIAYVNKMHNYNPSKSTPRPKPPQKKNIDHMTDKELLRLICSLSI